MQFSPKQEQALKAVADWFASKGKPIFRVFGYAGTGKTTLARHFAETIKGKVQYAAYTGKAAMVMRKNGCEGASTIHSMIYKVDQDEDTGITKFKKKPKFELQDIKLFVIDECSMVDDEIGRDLLSFGIPILVLGDQAQLPPVKGGGYFTNDAPDVMLTEIHRQAAENPIIRIATDVREGRKVNIGEYGAVSVIGKADVTTELVMSASQVLVGTNRSRGNYNRRLRELHGRTSPLPVPGDQLVALRNCSELGIFNGGLWSVLEMKNRRKGHAVDHCVHMHVFSLDFEGAAPVEVRVREEFFNGDAKGIDWRELRGTQQFDYGYALTVHKAQGSQWDDVCLFDESAAFGADRARWLYTGITRASETLTMVV